MCDDNKFSIGRELPTVNLPLPGRYKSVLVQAGISQTFKIQIPAGGALIVSGDEVEGPGNTVHGFAATFGDGQSVTFDIVHGLDTNDVEVEVYDIATGVTEIVSVTRIDVDTIRLTYLVAPANASKRVVVIG